MRRVAVITDSSTCLPGELAGEFDIRVLPISVFLHEEGELAGSTSDSDRRLTETAEHEELTGANHPFVTEYLAAIEGSGRDSAVVITPAIEFASMYRNAELAAELARCPTIAVDARTAAAGQALVVLAGAEAAAGGATLEEVVRTIEDASRRVELVASLATLEPIRRSGPVPEEVLAGSGSSDSRAVFRMRAGTVELLGGATSAEETLETIARAYREGANRGIERSAVFHAEVPELAERLRSMLQPVDFVSGFSLAMQVHTGRGVVGAAWIPTR